MKIKLSKPFAPNSKVDEFDVRQLKKALNRLQYYQPHKKDGITGIPDTAVFQALKAFQKDQKLPVTGTAKPDDETIQALNAETAKNQQGHYVWCTVGDDKVRASHAKYDQTVRAWSDSPDPGDDYNCRCWAEPVSDSDIQKEELQPLQPQERNIPGTNIPDHGIPEQGWPGSPKYDPYKPGPLENPDRYFDKKPPQSPYMPTYENLPCFPQKKDI